MKTPPKELLEVMRRTARELRSSLERVGWLSKGHGSPIPERNTVIHIASALRSKGFATFAEAQIRDGKKVGAKGFKKIDLLACNGELTFVIEVKAFGRRSTEMIMSDIHRLQVFSPHASEFGNHGKEIRGKTGLYLKPNEFWEKSEKWAVVVVQNSSKANEDFRNRWIRMTRDCDSGKRKGMFRKLCEDLDRYHAVSGGEKVLGEDYWENTRQLDILWLAFPLPVKSNKKTLS